MRASTTIRVRPTTRDRLARIGKQRGISTADLLDDLARRAEDEDLVAGLNEDFVKLRRDPEAWREHLAETALWDQTSSDRLR
jgi:hypothetical protein